MNDAAFSGSKVLLRNSGASLAPSSLVERCPGSPAKRGSFQPGGGRLSVLKSRVCTQYFCLSPRLRGPCATYDHVRLSPDQLGDAPGQGGAWAQGYSWVVPGAGFQPVDQGLLSGGGTRGACFTLIFISYCLTNLHDKIGVFQK